MCKLLEMFLTATKGGMRNIFLILLLSSLLLNCKKETDLDPVISFISPSGQILLLAGDSIQVEADVSDDRSLTSISLQLFYMNEVPASSAVVYQPQNNSFHISTLYHVNNTLLESGHYLLTITASDGKNKTRLAREIEIQALPVERLKVFAITASTSNVFILELDSLHGQTLFKNLNGDYLSSSLSSRHQRLNILGKNSGLFTVLDSKNGSIVNEISGLCPIGNQCFEHLHFQDELNFISYHDGQVKAYDADGLQQFEIEEDGYFRPNALYRLGNYLVAEILYLNPPVRKIGVFFYPSGVQALEAALDMNIISIFSKSDDEVFLFGHSNGLAVVEIFDLRINRTSPLRTLGNMSIHSVYQFQSEEFYIATDQGLWNYKVNLGAFTQSTTIPTQRVDYDPIMNEIFLVEGNTIKVLDAGTSLEKKQYSLADSVLNIHFLYNK